MPTEAPADTSGPPSAAAEAEAPPPLLSSWPRLYALVLGELGLVVVLLWALGRWAS